jgi:hypothetical protein
LRIGERPFIAEMWSTRCEFVVFAGEMWLRIDLASQNLVESVRARVPNEALDTVLRSTGVGREHRGRNAVGGGAAGSKKRCSRQRCDDGLDVIAASGEAKDGRLQR